MKIVVRGIRDELLKEEVKAIIREFCECDSVHAKGFFSGRNQSGHLRGVEIYPTGSTSMIGRITFNIASRTPKSYVVIKRRRAVKTYAL